jgi:ankyrin repeat protein
MEELLEAIRMGDKEEVIRLVDADPALLEMEDNEENIPVTVALEHGQNDIRCLLIQRGADVRAGKEGMTALHAAALMGAEELADLMVSYGARVSARDSEERTPFMTASMNGHLSIARKLVQHTGQEGLEDRDRRGSTALFLAAQAGHAEVVTYLLSIGANPGSKDIIHKTTLITAVSGGHMGVVQALVHHLGKQGLDERDGEGMTALHWAAIHGHEEVAVFLLNHGASVDCKDLNERTTLMFASVGGRVGLVRLLAKHMGGRGLDGRDKDGRTALQMAAADGRDEVVAFLLSQGVQANRGDISERTPLMFASMNGRMGVVRVLVQHMGKEGLDKRDKDGATALDLAALKGHEEIVGHLLERGAAANERGNNGVTPVMYACMNGHTSTVKRLTQYLDGEALGCRDTQARTALDWAAMAGYVDVVAVLCEAGAPVHSRDRFGVTALALAAHASHKDVVQALLRHMGGKGLDDRGQNGRTAMHWAVERAQAEIVRILLVAGADPTAADDEHMTPRAHAERRGHASCVAVFKVSPHAC